MNNYQRKAREEILDLITVRCKDCHRLMDRMQTATAFYCLYCDRCIEFLSVTTDSILNTSSKISSNAQGCLSKKD